MSKKPDLENPLSSESEKSDDESVILKPKKERKQMSEEAR